MIAIIPEPLIGIPGTLIGIVRNPHVPWRTPDQKCRRTWREELFAVFIDCRSDHGLDNA
jgi:hypothetical protein